MNVEKQIVQLVIQHLGIKEVSTEASFTKDLKADSLDMTDLLQAIDEEFGLNIHADKMSKVDTVRELIELVKRELSH